MFGEFDILLYCIKKIKLVVFLKVIWNTFVKNLDLLIPI